MAQKQPERSPEHKTLSQLVIEHLNRRDWSCAELARRSHLSKTTVHRIVTDTDHRGNPYHTSIDVVAALVIAFQLNNEEANELFYAAFPQFRLWKEARDRHYTIEKTNYFLDENGFPVLKA